VRSCLLLLYYYYFDALDFVYALSDVNMNLDGGLKVIDNEGNLKIRVLVR
jgi:hypothetical protein